MDKLNSVIDWAAHQIATRIINDELSKHDIWGDFVRNNMEKDNLKVLVTFKVASGNIRTVENTINGVLRFIQVLL